ncbi:putative nose resistant to fluoxetine protein 6-like, partial [Apostichopus japonicus]
MKNGDMAVIQARWLINSDIIWAESHDRYSSVESNSAELKSRKNHTEEADVIKFVLPLKERSRDVKIWKAEYLRTETEQITLTLKESPNVHRLFVNEQDVVYFVYFPLDFLSTVRASNANPPTLITMAFTGNVQYLANFELCVAVKENPSREIPMTAKVCDMNVPPYPFQIGLCVPESCSDVDLYLFVNAVLAKYNINRGVYFTCVIDRPWTWDSIFVMIILCLFGVAAIVGTTYDLVFRRRKNTETTVIVNVSTTQKDTNIDEAAREDEAGRLPLKEGAPQTGREVPTPGAVSSANEHDQKVENIERGEVTTNQAVSSGNDNANYVYTEIGSKPWFAFNWEAPYGVDTFLVLSGLLVTYLTLKQLDKSDGKMNWVMFYVHRYIRLTPVYMVCLGIWTSIVIQIGEGSRKYEAFAGGRAVCQQYWWANLLYINNLVPYPGNVSQCMGWTWYLANDMQFFIFSPIFIILLY